MSIKGNNFTKNTAKTGPVIRTLGAINFDFMENSVNDNQAVAGGIIASNPISIRLVIYEVKEAFLYIENLSFDYMINHYTTVIHIFLH